MSQGRYSQRGWAFQSFAFRTWGLAGADGDVVEVAIVTTRLSLVGTSRQRLSIEGTSMERMATVGTSQKRLTIEGSSR
jgi:hypothetical protein